jgi:DNA-binding transcriptional LysR family regulator
MRATRFVELNAFVAVAERKSFTRAADDLGMSTSALSQSISGLEDSIGVRLLNRTTRSVEVTEAGEQVLERVRPLLSDFATVVGSVSESRDKPAGRLRLTVPPPVASFVLPKLVRRFLAQYPDIVVDITVESSLIDIVMERYDAGIRIGGRLARDMIATRITDDLRFVVAASPSYLARHQPPETPEDLSVHNCIRTRFESGTFDPGASCGAARSSRPMSKGPWLRTNQRSWFARHWMGSASFTCSTAMLPRGSPRASLCRCSRHGCRRPLMGSFCTIQAGGKTRPHFRHSSISFAPMSGAGESRQQRCPLQRRERPAARRRVADCSTWRLSSSGCINSPEIACTAIG